MFNGATKEYLEHVSNSLCAYGGPEELKKVRSFLSEAPTHAHSEQALNVLNRAPCNEGKDSLFATYVVGYCVRQMSLDTLQILFFFFFLRSTREISGEAAKVPTMSGYELRSRGR